MKDALKQSTAESRPPNSNALDLLVRREEVLQIAFWYEGEGFGQIFDAAALAVFLNCAPETVENALSELVARGSLEPNGPGFRFTEKGRQESSRLFAEGFADYQKAGHGECMAGCCEDGDHSQCGDECAQH